MKLIRKAVHPAAAAKTVRVRNRRKLRLLIDRRTIRPERVTVLFLHLGGHVVAGLLLISVGVRLGVLLGQELDWDVRVWWQVLDQPGVFSTGAGLEIQVVGR